MEGSKSFEEYPGCIIFTSNLVSFLIYVIGAYIISQIGIIWLVAYLFYVLWLEVRLMRRSCVNCYYFGKFCAFGKGKISSLLFKKGNLGGFIKRRIIWKDIVPDFLVSAIPIIAGIVLLISNFDWLILAAIASLIILVSAGNAFVRGSLACKYCRQKEIGCPAEQLFNKKKSQ